jgi:hypothetical protein
MTINFQNGYLLLLNKPLKTLLSISFEFTDFGGIVSQMFLSASCVCVCVCVKITICLFLHLLTYC